MKTKKEIKQELKQIKYYYMRKKEYECNAKRVIGNCIVDIVAEYNEIISYAPIQLYDIYLSLYTENCNQACIAEDLEVSPEYISILNRKLIEYLEQKFNE